MAKPEKTSREYRKRGKRTEKFADGSSVTELPDGGMLISERGNKSQVLGSDSTEYRISTTEPKGEINAQ